MGVAHEAYERLDKYIARDESLVGVNARRSHILILHKLMEIERKLDNLSHIVTTKGS